MGKYTSGITIEYVCNKLYVKKEGNNFKLTCQDDGTWNSTAIPICILGIQIFIF